LLLFITSLVSSLGTHSQCQQQVRSMQVGQQRGTGPRFFSLEATENEYRSL
jgi:hypothetical protein